ncbi:MAG: hypothetical protein JRC87_05130 [Deltaproteobacteria bacterium]|nr:hypothetical protein [Deltaproteobacteria bacterium]MBW2658973.1 hypothetical protein [Deltaproteobacteria bacterium]
MLDFLNRFGLPVKYAIIGAVSVTAGVFFAGILGMNIAMSYFSAAISGAAGGAIGGWIRQRKGKSN